MFSSRRPHRWISVPDRGGVRRARDDDRVRSSSHRHRRDDGDVHSRSALHARHHAHRDGDGVHSRNALRARHHHAHRDDGVRSSKPLRPRGLLTSAWIFLIPP